MKIKTKMYWGIATVVCLALIYYISTMASNNSQNCATAPAAEMDIGGHESLTMHIHQMLTISIDGESIIIPANIGLPSGVMRPIHTHDSSGKLHVEGTCQRDFTLGEFFDIWEQTFTEQCIMSSCIDETHTLKVFVNGVESTEYRSLVLKDGNEIEIVYEETV